MQEPVSFIQPVLYQRDIRNELNCVFLQTLMTTNSEEKAKEAVEKRRKEIEAEEKQRLAEIERQKAQQAQQDQGPAKS